MTVVSDVQLHNHARWATILPGGRNSRLQDGINALDQAVEAAAGGPLVVCGDLLHDQRSIDVAVLDAAAAWVQRASAACSRVVLLAGNHDHYLKDGSIHSLRAFEGGNVEVVAGGAYLEGMGAPVFAHAYTEDLPALAAALEEVPDDHVVLLHQSVTGGVMNGGRVCEGGLAVSSLSRFRLVLLGHFHMRQDLAPNVHYVGSPYQIDKGEMGERKYMVRVPTEGPPEWLETSGMPEYRTVSYDAFRATRDHGNHFWEVECDDAQRQALAESPPDANYEVVPAPRTDLPTPAAQGDLSPITAPGAVEEWLVREGRPDLVERALSRMVVP